MDVLQSCFFGTLALAAAGVGDDDHTISFLKCLECGMEDHNLCGKAGEQECRTVEGRHMGARLFVEERAGRHSCEDIPLGREGLEHADQIRFLIALGHGAESDRQVKEPGNFAQHSRRGLEGVGLGGVTACDDLFLQVADQKPAWTLPFRFFQTS